MLTVMAFLGFLAIPLGIGLALVVVENRKMRHQLAGTLDNAGALADRTNSCARMLEEVARETIDDSAAKDLELIVMTLRGIRMNARELSPLPGIGWVAWYAQHKRGNR